jgi:xylan 1,4-beta-xylosidase
MHVRRKEIFTLIILAGLWSCGIISENENAQNLTICNPVNIEYRFTEGKPSRRMAADPVIVLFKDTYYLFSTGSSEYWYSENLVTWTMIPEEVSELPDRPTAPAATVIDDALYFIPSSSRDSSRFYKSSDPKSGKWELAAKSIPAWDPALFLDDDGRVYNYFGCSNRRPISGFELDKLSFKPRSEIIDFLVADTKIHGWERQGDNNELSSAPWIEGAWMTKHNDTYYLQYAAPGTEFKSYADGIYTSKNPLGPYSYESYSPFSHKPTGFITSAGHGATFQDTYGNYWRVVTMVIAVHNMFERRLGIFPAGFDNDGVMYTNTLLGDFPQIIHQRKRDPFENNLDGWMLLSYGKNASASSSISGYEPVLAVDEKITTWWCALTSDDGEWLQVDLGEVANVHAVQVNYAEHDANLFGRENPIYQQYILYYSNDAKNWQTLIDKSINTKDVPHDYTQLPKAVKARFIKLVNIHMPGDGPFAIRDLRVFGKGLGNIPQKTNGLTVTRNKNDRCNTRITWNKNQGATGYVIRYGINPDKLYNEYQVMGNTELTINSLNSDVVYYFSLDAFNENGYTRGSNIIEVY